MEALLVTAIIAAVTNLIGLSVVVACHSVHLGHHKERLDKLELKHG